MSLPTITPTGSMSSGNYVDYMISYMDGALTSLESDISDNYIPDNTVTTWYAKWDTVLTDIESRVTTLGSNLNAVASKIQMLKDAVGRL